MRNTITFIFLSIISIFWSNSFLSLEYLPSTLIFHPFNVFFSLIIFSFQISILERLLTGRDQLFQTISLKSGRNFQHSSYLKSLFRNTRESVLRHKRTWSDKVLSRPVTTTFLNWRTHSGLARNLSSFSNVGGSLLLDQVYNLPLKSSSIRLWMSMIELNRELQLLVPQACFYQTPSLGCWNHPQPT